MRYQVREGSQSAHCCFDATVVDTDKPYMIRDEHYSPNGVPRYEAVCECFDVEDAELIANALNEATNPRYAPTEAGLAALRGEG